MQVDVSKVITRAIRKRFRSLSKGLFSLVSSEHILSLADQAVVSGTGFLTTILVARWSDSSQLGIYAIGMSFLFSLTICQDSLILEPYLIQRYYPQGTPSERAGASLTFSLLFSAGSMLALAIAALIFEDSRASPELIMMTWVIAGIAPFVLARNFARRFSFARLEVGGALLLDTAIAVIQLTSLAWLGANGRMSALSACVALGGTYAVAAAGWLYWMRAEFAVRVKYIRTALKETWALGKWLLAGQITVQLPGNFIYWLLMAVLGAAVTGVYAACMSIVAVANPLMQGLRNVVMPKMVLAWKNGSGLGLWHEAVRTTMLIAAVMAPISLVVAIAGEPIMRVLYHANEFAGHHHILTVLSLAGLCGALGTPASIALATMARPRAIVTVSTAAAVVTLILVWVLMNEWGLIGVAYGLLGGSVFGTLGRWIALLTRIFKSCAFTCDPEAATRALQDFTKRADHDCWTITRLGSGAAAETFLAQSEDPQIERDADALVIKVYKADTAFDMVRAEFDSLVRLRSALDGRNINGWTISVANPLHLCMSPLALVMTPVRGRHIESYASNSDIGSSNIIAEAARTCAMAMQQCWSTGERHGDLGLPNILFDLENKEVSFIDAGTVCHICNDCTNVLAPAREIGHFLDDVATDLNGLIGRSPVCISKEIFVEHFLLATIESLGLRDHRRRFLSEIWFWAQQHQAMDLERDWFWAQQQPSRYLDVSWSIRAAWFRFVKQVATYRIRWILKRVEAQSNGCEQTVCEWESYVEPTQPIVN